MNNLQNILRLIVFLFFSGTVHSQVFPKIEKGKVRSGVKFGTEWIVKPVYDSIIELSHYVFITEKKGYYGMLFLDQKQLGSELTKEIKCNYTDVIYNPVVDFHGDMHFGLRDKKGLYAIFDSNGKRLSGFEFEELKLLTVEAFFRKPKDKWNLFRYTLKEEVSINADSVTILENPSVGLAFVGKQANGSYEKIVYVDLTTHEYKYNAGWGRKRFFAESFSLHTDHYELYPVNEKGRIVKRDGYKSVAPTRDGMFIVYLHNERVDLLDSNFLSVPDHMGSEISVLKEHYIITGEPIPDLFGRHRTSSNYSLYNYKTGNNVFHDYDSIVKVSENAVLVKQNGKTAQMIYFTDTQKQFDFIAFFTDKFVIVTVNTLGKKQYQLLTISGENAGQMYFQDYRIENDTLQMESQEGNVKTIVKVGVNSNGQLIVY